MGIILSVKLPECDAQAFEAAVETLLRSYGAQINKLTAADGHILLRAYKDSPCATVEPAPVKAEEPPPPAPEPTPEPVADLPPPPPVDTADPVPTELTVAIPSADAIVASGEVSFKDFPTKLAIPFSLNSAMEQSVLQVNDLSIVAEHAHFTFNGMSFKFPVDENTRIRVMAAFNEDELVPVLLKLEDSKAAPSVAFGNDVAEIVSKLFPTTTPAQA